MTAAIVYIKTKIFRDADEKAISEEYSSLINKAYVTLQTPLNRALHLLHLRNVHINEDDKVNETNFLSKIMELNEEIEEANSPEELNALNDKNKATLNELVAEISKYFAEDDLVNVKNSVVKMKYYESINLRINNLLRERGIVN